MSSAIKIYTDAPESVEYKRKKWFLNLQKIIKLFIKKPEYIYLGKNPGPASIILSNHEGASVPLTMEIYAGLQARFWGAHEMDKGFKTAYRYQTVTYYHRKKHWNLFLARLFCLIATPLTRLFYIGLELVPTYPDLRFKNTLKRSIDALKNGNTLIVFPENSEDGYHEVLKEFRPGAVMLLEQCKRHGLDVEVFVAYYKKKTRQHIFAAPVTVGQLLKTKCGRKELAQILCNQCNQLGQMDI